MKSVAVQIGHVNGKAGAAYEEATLKMIYPHVVTRLKAAGLTVGEFDGSLQFEPANYQYRYDAAVFLHCDSGTVKSTGFSIGFWEECHPGSKALAHTLKRVYGEVSGLKFIGFNITAGEHHYYGNRRFASECKCTLIEYGFVSNPSERAFLQSCAKRLGTATADAVIAYLQVGPPEEEEVMQTVLQADIEPGTTWKTVNLGGTRKGKVYVDATNNSDKVAAFQAVVQLSPSGNYGTRKKDIPVAASKVPGFISFEVGEEFQNPAMGIFSIEFSATQPVTVKVTQEMV